MNTMESKAPSLHSLYNQRLSNLSNTLSSLHSKISDDPSVLLLQTHPILEKYQTDRINELVKQIIDDERETTLISCLEAYHKLQSEVETLFLVKSMRSEANIINEDKQKELEILRRKDIERIEICYELDESKLEIKRLKEQLMKRESSKLNIQNDLRISIDFERSNLQNLVHSLTIENRRLREQNDKITEFEHKEKRVQQRFIRQNHELKQQIHRLKNQLENKHYQLSQAKKQIQEISNESSNKIQLSEKYSYLTQYKRSQFIHQAGSLLQLQHKNKFRVAEFQELCYEMSKQEQELKLIRMNFRKFKQIVQTGVKNHLQWMRKIIIAIKSKMQEEIEDSQRQMARFVELFEGKAGKILAHQKTFQAQKIQMMKSEYQQKILALQQRNKSLQIQQKKFVSDVEIKIKDQRINQLEIEVSNTKQLQTQYKQLLLINQQLKGKLNHIQISNRQPTIQSPQRLITYPSNSIPTLSYLETSPQIQNHSNFLRSSKSLSPKTPANILPSSPTHYTSKLNIPLARTNFPTYELRYNPESFLEHPTSDSRARKQLETGFNELQEQIQAIIERRNKRNIKNTFRY